MFKFGAFEVEDEVDFNGVIAVAVAVTAAVVVTLSES